MPDWSYHPLFKPLLKKLKPETGRHFIHKGMSTIASVPGGRQLIEFLGHMNPSPELSNNKWETTYPTSVGLSGRMDPELSGTKAFCHLGFGFIEIGPIGTEARTSSLHVDWEKETIHGLEGNSTSIEHALLTLNRLPAKHQPIWARISKDVWIYPQLDQLFNKVDAVVIDWDDLDKLNGLSTNLPILVNLLASQLNQLKLPDQELVSGYIIEMDSISATAKAEIKNLLAHQPNLSITLRGNISDPETAVEWLQLGVDFILLEDGYVFSGPGLPKRINELLLKEKMEHPVYPNKNWVYHFIFGLLITFGGLLALIFALTRVILPYDEWFLGATREDILLFNPQILAFMEHDRMTLAGTMISGGIVYMQLAYHGIRRGIHWSKKAFHTAGIVGFLGILLFIGYGYFDWLHALFWAILLPAFLLGYKNSSHATLSPMSPNTGNNVHWKKAVWGQMCLVMLGFSLTIGGAVISTIGVSFVFVPTDLTFICMTPDQLDSFNQQLIPVIAHDRAGFGSALIAVGLLVLMLALWGFQQGAKWVWHTFLWGGIPAFLAGLTTHYLIGYIDFVHLLPAYFALLLFVVGLGLSRSYFFMRDE